jgi:cysteine desulfurase
VLDAMGVDPAISSGAIRVSMGWNTTADDVARFISILNSLRARHVSRRAA